MADDFPQLSDVLRCSQAPVDVNSINTDATPQAPGGKRETLEQFQPMAEELSELQERLFARGRNNPDHARRVLIVLQGLDTAGKGGVVRHVVAMVDPQGINHHGFKAPTQEELRHDFLWRVKKALPEPGMLGVFDRSHYEDVLVPRVENLVEEEVWRKRYDLINDFEMNLVARGTNIIKCFLHISPGVQKERLAARLNDPAKYWKYDPGDLDTRSKWAEYIEAYNKLLSRCNPDIAPWYIIPSDHKWYRNWAMGRILLETMRSMKLTWPPANFDVEAEKRRLEQA
ncbi:polyphosphate--nucleotide phosphotransferase [Cutibacterium acnes]|uniref:PPK2 family polyphosphate kinase n=1 Tax=Cutibacterium acnes TaxID=1747 RepID=UPI0001F09A05|nr:polyphosphate--nucleotide phosphotransferase [Cutibacterium acnes]EFT65336.1 polyphosphate:nucleotide phosphotransferase, PPK2 family [Cutibacterium acnes HL060PA1]MCK6133530.1 polyphosphate--nucleotide phosphotransferase [Cutibacterium acnes]PGF55136.1 polyphosphate--nucleotide phosphotransferase [Cutibacterium acnes subsp. defendens]